MASGDTKTEAMLNVLGNGGTGDEFRGCCNTKTQSYILDAIDRINALQPGGSSDFNDLENRPQLNSVAMTGNTNITNFTGTDGTAAGAQGLVPAPAAADADKFLKSDGTWDIAGGGATNFRTLTDDDLSGNYYNAHELPTGVYVVPKTNPNHSVRIGNKTYSGDNQLMVVSKLAYSMQVLFFGGTVYGTVLTNMSTSGAEYDRSKLATEYYVNNLVGVKIDSFTTKDWPTSNPDGVALWKLPGDANRYYFLPNSQVKIYITPDHSFTGNINGDIRLIKTGGATADYALLVSFDLAIWDHDNNDNMYGVKGYGVTAARTDTEKEYKTYTAS